MLDDFFTRALLAGIGLALTTGPLGCFVVWRRMAYFGDTMAHSALLGVALGFLLEIDPTVGVFAVTVLVSLALLALERRGGLSADALLGILSHAALALGLVVLAFMTWVRVDLMGFLFGDILAVSKLDVVLIWSGGAVVLALLAFLWRPLLAASVDEELAAAEGLSPARSRLVFMLMMALVVAIAMKLVGVLLITALMIIPAATARRFAATPEQMAVLASDLAVSPVTPEILAARELRRGTVQLIEDVAPFRNLGIEPPPLKLLLNRVPAVSANARLIEQSLRLIFCDDRGVEILRTEVPAIEVFQRAASHGLPAHRMEPRRPSGRLTPAALEIVRSLAIELCPQWKEKFAQVSGRAGGRQSHVDRA